MLLYELNFCKFVYFKTNEIFARQIEKLFLNLDKLNWFSTITTAMGEILQIQIGQSGNRIGSDFWKTIADEHGLDEQSRFVGNNADTQLERINVYYEETSSQVYVPRAVFVDSDSSALDSIAGTSGGGGLCGNAFRPENFVGGHGGSSVKWIRGYYPADGLSNRAMDAIRLEAERCDRLQGFQIVHSLGGGTGSGLGMRVMDDVGRTYPNRTVNTFSVVPTPTVSSRTDPSAATVETYNAVLSVARLIDGAHNTYLVDNRALYDACSGPLKIAAPAFADLNHLVSQTVSGVTAGLRFAGDANADMKKCTANLVPYARLHFHALGFAPLTYRGQSEARAHTVPELAGQLFASVGPRRCGGERRKRRPVVVAAATTFRGHGLRLNDVQLKRVASAAASADHMWLPNNVTAAGYAVPTRGLQTSGTIVANTTAVNDAFDDLYRRYMSALANKAYLHLYTDSGMTVDDFHQARRAVESLTAEYRSLEDDGDDEAEDHVVG